MFSDDRELRSLSTQLYHMQTSAGSGEEGLEVLGDRKVDICIVDMRLPGIDGNEVIQRSRTLSPGTRFLIHTGSSDYQLPQDLLKSGIDPRFVFRKPLSDMSVLLAAVTRLLGPHIS